MLCYLLFFLMIRPPPRSTRTDTLFPYTTLCRSYTGVADGEVMTGPFNPTSGKPYRGINRIWLDMQGHEDPRWLTYDQATAAGAQVRKGERSTTVEYWKWTERQPVRDAAGNAVLDDDGRQVHPESQLTRPKVFYARVFNAEKIDGLAPSKDRKRKR